MVCAPIQIFTQNLRAEVSFFIHHFIGFPFLPRAHMLGLSVFYGFPCLCIFVFNPATTTCTILTRCPHPPCKFFFFINIINGSKIYLVLILLSSRMGCLNGFADSVRGRRSGALLVTPASFLHSCLPFNRRQPEYRLWKRSREIET